MKSIRIFKKDNGNKEWCEVKFSFKFDGDNSWLPKLEDLAFIAKIIYECEDNKYQNGRGGEMVRDYLNDALSGMTIEDLDKKYEIPVSEKGDKFNLYSVKE